MGTSTSRNDLVIIEAEDVDIVPSKQFSNNLYHFDNEPDLIFNAITSGGFTLNYVEEDFSFLGLPPLQTIAFPMKCFCDIVADDSRIKTHMGVYGHFGIGLSKRWGKSVGVQPVHYLITGSPFADDLKAALDVAFNLDSSSFNAEVEILSDFLVTVLAYAKPTFGKRLGQPYCFEDECEWRFIPTDLPQGLETVLFNPGEDELANYRGTIWMSETYLLKFSYEEVTDIFVPDEASEAKVLNVINSLMINEKQKNMDCCFLTKSIGKG